MESSNVAPVYARRSSCAGIASSRPLVCRRRQQRTQALLGFADGAAVTGNRAHPAAEPPSFLFLLSSEHMAELGSQPTSIQSVYSWYADDKLYVNRRYQRKLVWTLVEKQKLLES